MCVHMLGGIDKSRTVEHFSQYCYHTSQWFIIVKSIFVILVLDKYKNIGVGDLIIFIFSDEM